MSEGESHDEPAATKQRNDAEDLTSGIGKIDIDNNNVGDVGDTDGAEGDKKGAIELLEDTTYTGRCKWFNVRKGYGYIVPVIDGNELGEGYDIFIHQTNIQMDGFRSLDENEPVEFRFKNSSIGESGSTGREATIATGPDGTKCKGAQRRSSKKNARCYKCGEMKGHMAAQCPLAASGSVCYNCKSPGHISRDCPEPRQEHGRKATQN